MEKCLSKFFLILALIFLSCGNTAKLTRENPYHEYVNKINYLGRHRTGTIILANEKWFKADKIEIINDSLFCIDSETQVPKSYNIMDVHKISFKDRFIGGFYGACLGGFIGICSGIGVTGPYPIQYAILIFGVTGAIPGYLIGSDLNFVFVNFKK